MSDETPGFLRLYWSGGGDIPGVTLVARHYLRAFSEAELRALAAVVEAIESFRLEVEEAG